MDEFEIISTFFKREYDNQNIVAGSGDDAACLKIGPDSLLCVSTDTFVEGVHFLQDWQPNTIAAKLVTVNVSDMVAMAAVPKWATLALTLPEVNQAWLKLFSEGLFSALDELDIALVGGDITRGPLVLTMTIHGECSSNNVTFRYGAEVGDIIYVTGPLGAPALAVDWLSSSGIDQHAKSYLMSKLLRPTARVDCRSLIGQFASACIDISDGLVGDLGHICEQSQIGAMLISEQIPIDKVVKKQVPKQALSYALHGGDEYQLCFTVNCDKKKMVELVASQQGLLIYPIGHMVEKQGLNIMVDGETTPITSSAYKHFQ